MAEGTVHAADNQEAPMEDVRRFKGEVSLAKAPATSFQSYNIEISVRALIVGQTRYV